MLSVCAFRLGLMQDALNLVADLYATGKIKELLAQGVGQGRWQPERDSDQEKIERRRQVPYHMHISLDLLESVHLISALLLEIPNLAMHASDDKRHVISRNFRRLWDSFHKNAFNGPPENTRDYVIAAAVALSEGDWKNALDNLMQLKMWSVIPFPEAAQAALTRLVKEVALETFLLALGANYVTIAGDRLAARFDMSERDVHAVASRLMANDRLQGAWDVQTKSIQMKAVVPNGLQSSALRFADQIGILIEQNERSLEHRHTHSKAGGGGKDGPWQTTRPVVPAPRGRSTAAEENGGRW
jgi:translation initiation factor 3 subunit C